MEDFTIFYFISTIVVLVTLTFLILEYVVKKWKCTSDKKCIKVIGGQFSSYQECKNSCNNDDSPISDKEVDVDVSIEQPRYSCVDNIRCQQMPNGRYSSPQECQQNCPTKIVVQEPVYSYGNPYGFPYGNPYGFPYGNRRHWSPRRHLRRSHHHHRRHK